MIIDKYFDTNPAFWSEVQHVYNKLGAQGMSSDETDLETSTPDRKVVRRVSLVWLAEEISTMWSKLEAFHLKMTGVQPHKGNSAFLRLSAPKHFREDRVVPGLPKNYYSSIWWTSLYEARQARVRALEAKSLPYCDE